MLRGTGHGWCVVMAAVDGRVDGSLAGRSLNYPLPSILIALKIPGDKKIPESSKCNRKQMRVFSCINSITGVVIQFSQAPEWLPCIVLTSQRNEG